MTQVATLSYADAELIKLESLNMGCPTRDTYLQFSRALIDDIGWTVTAYRMIDKGPVPVSVRKRTSECLDRLTIHLLFIDEHEPSVHMPLAVFWRAVVTNEIWAVSYGKSGRETSRGELFELLELCRRASLRQDHSNPDRMRELVDSLVEPLKMYHSGVRSRRIQPLHVDNLGF